MISDVYFPRINGVSSSIATCRDSLRALGHDVTLIAPAYPSGRQDEHWVMRIPSRAVWGDPEDRMMKYRAIMALAPVLRRMNFDIVHIQTPFVAHYAGLRLARLLCLPVIATCHTNFEEYLGCYIRFLPDNLLRRFTRRIFASQGNAVDALVAPSTAMLDKVRNYGVNAESCVIPTGIDLEHFKEGNGTYFRHILGIEPGRRTLLYTGRVAHEKNIDFLIQVVAEIRNKLPDILLIITGEGPAEAHLRNLATRLGVEDNVLFVGYLDRKRTLLDCYAAADIFVFSSHTETQGLVLLEAMAMGLPVVAFARMGTRDILRDGMGALIAADNDCADFSAKVMHLLCNHRARYEQRKRAREHALSWSNDACTERLFDFYSKIIAKSELVTEMGQITHQGEITP